MMIDFFNKTNFNSLFFKLVIFFLISISSIYFYVIFNNLINTSSYAYNELFINYQAGFIRRGLLGEIFWQLHEIFFIKPLTFFSYLFLILYLTQIYLFISIYKFYKSYNFIFLLIFFSPALILFTFYEPNLYFIKDVIVKLTILLHAYIIIIRNKKKKLNIYIKDLKIIILPILTLSILIHEYQVIFLSIHILLSLTFVNTKSEVIKILKIYFILVIPIILVLIFIGNLSQYESLNLILKKFDITNIHSQLSGGFYKAVGGFYKWHFYYFGYKDFIQFLSSLLLGVGIFFFIFHYFIEKNILELKNYYQKNYLYFFIPTLLCFLLALDHGRNISLLSTHLIAFYAVLKLDTKKLDNIRKKINSNFLLKCFLIIFLFFYIFMWRLDQMAGFGGAEQINTIFQSSIFAELIKLIKFIYIYIDLNITNLPDINL